ncbi:MAG: TonB family protein [Deltaproteobacteria bacterium]|nr:TonB family protein [Deltaproteobacteria bacterium]
MSHSSVPTSSLHAPVVSRPFALWLSASVGLHVAVLVGYTLWDAAQVHVIDFPDEPIKAQLVKLGKPRDPKLLPRLQTAPKPAPAKDTAVPVPNLNSKEDKKLDDRMKDALQRIQEESERDKQREDALARIADRVGKAQPEEDEGQEDGHVEGTAPTATQVNAYLGLLASRVKARYQVPSVITPPECARLVAQVMVRMGPDGALLDTRIHKTSGNDLFDSAVISAVKQAAPLPRPPDNMMQMVKTGFGFNFRCAQ